LSLGAACFSDVQSDTASVIPFCTEHAVKLAEVARRLELVLHLAAFTMDSVSQTTVLGHGYKLLFHSDDCSVWI